MRWPWSPKPIPLDLRRTGQTRWSEIKRANGLVLEREMIEAIDMNSLERLWFPFRDPLIVLSGFGEGFHERVRKLEPSEIEP